MTLASTVGALLVLATAFPYFQFIPLSPDSYTQPWPYLAACVALCTGRAPWSYLTRQSALVLAGFAILGALVFLVSVKGHGVGQEHRYLLSYVAPLALVPAFLRLLVLYPGMVRSLLVGTILTWCAVGLVQTLGDPAFATGWLGRWSESASDIASSGRGVIALAPEPTHHAFHILLLAASLALVDADGRYRWVLLVAILDAVVLALSSSAIAALGLAAVVLAARRHPVYAVIAGAGVVLAWTGVPVLFAMIFGTDARVTRLVVEVVLNPSHWLQVDYSVNIRAGGLWFVMTEVWRQDLLPHGLAWQTWLSTRQVGLPASPWLMGLSEVGPPSGLFAILYQTGALAIPFLVALFRPILRLAGQPLIVQILLVTTPFVFLAQYYLSAPSFSLLLAAALYREQQA